MRTVHTYVAPGFQMVEHQDLFFFVRLGVEEVKKGIQLLLICPQRIFKGLCLLMIPPIKANVDVLSSKNRALCEY